jgi:hypothetical protein
MANEAKTADTTAKTNEIITAEAVEVPSSFDDVPTIEGSSSSEMIVVPTKDISTAFYCSGKTFVYPKKTKDGRDSKLADEQYWVATYNGKAFTTQDASFIEALRIGDMHEVRLKRNGEYLEFVGFTTASTFRNAIALQRETAELQKQINDLNRDEAENRAMSTKRISWINNLDLKTVAPDESLMQKLLGNTVE